MQKRISGGCSDPPEGVQDHGEEDKLAEEGDHEGGRGNDLSQEEEEHGEREQDGDGEAHLVCKYCEK